MAGANARAAMFTVCPKCALTLVVTAADLRVAQGYVRCGRCSSVFNALARLSDERQAALPDGEPAVAPEPEPETPAQGEQADLSPLEEALSRPQEGTTSELPATDEEPVSEEALEFDPKTTDVGAVFVQPPPNPQWTAATGSFKALRAASREPTPEKATANEASDAQLDVEIDADFLAEMLREPAPADSARPHSEPPPAERAQTEPAPAEPAHAEPAPSEAPRATPQLQHRARPPRAAPPPGQPPTPAPAESPPEQGKATAGAVTRRAAPPGESPRHTVRHGEPHTRPPAEASTRPRSAPEPEPPPPAPEAQALQAIEEPTAAALDLDAHEATLPQRAMARFRLSREEPQVWGAGAVIGLLLLTAQIVNHYRDELAATPRFGRPLTTFYASLGVQLVPRWDLRAYDVRQLGAAADPAGRGLITVRASIKNAALQPQPLPLLRVTLQDRFGNRIAARDVAPRFYVPRTVPDSSYLAGGQRIDVEMGFVDPGANAVGFEIDACLPASGGGITCANDLATR
jgi:predicted Zn finger-like uncharacterized protein